MLPFRLVEPPAAYRSLPLYAYSVGRHHQFFHSRPAGFPAYQIFLIASGEGLFRDLSSGEEFVLSEGQALGLPSGHPHEYYPLSHEPWHIGFIGFLGELASPMLEQTGLLRPLPLRRETFEACWQDIHDMWTDANEPSPQLLSEISVRLYRLLLRLGEDAGTPETMSPARTDEVRNQALQQALLLMNQHYTEPLLVSNLASAVGYSPQHFQRLFIKQFAVTPLQYLQNLRMERALQLLKENRDSQIQDIARLVGMETNYFVRQFRRRFGQTPGAMRKSGNGEMPGSVRKPQA
jgi:AraC-like DNA-binding protein